MTAPESPALARLRQLLERPDPDLAEVRALLALDGRRTRPFFPALQLRPDPAAPDEAVEADPGAVLALARQARQQRYAARLAQGWRGPRLVSKGDGWMLFPLLKDLVAQLEEDHAVWCLSGEDDALDEGPGQQALAEALIELAPDALLLSAGGCQLLDGARLRAFLDPAGPRDRRDPRFSSYLEAFLAQDLMPRFRRLLVLVRAAQPGLPVLLHGYAAPVLRNHRWLSRPLAELGLEGPAAQERVRALLDRHHAALSRLVAEPGLGPVHLVDCRGLVASNWFDEMHPNDRGFEAVAEAFRMKLEAIL